MTTKQFILIAALCVALIVGGFALVMMQRLSVGPFAPMPTPAPTAAPTPEPTETPAPTEAPQALARIRAAGDIIIDTPMLEAAYSGGAYRFGRYFTHIADALGDADLTIVNIEGALAGVGTLGHAGYPSFNTPVTILDALKACGVDMLTMANNHALDRYFDGLIQSLKNVIGAGFLRTGAYYSQEDYDTPLVVDVNGIKLGFTNYTTGLNGVEKRSDKRATEYGIRIAQKADFEDDIARLRGAGAEAVVVFMHWDREYKRMPSSESRDYAKRLADAGADVIIGGHPHVVQPIEWIERKDGGRTLCLYSMGNFLSNHEGEFVDNGILFEVSFAKRSDGLVHVVDPQYMPVWVWIRNDLEEINYQTLPVLKAIQNRPEQMTDEQFARLQAAWNESVEILGQDIAKPIG